jgi:hypothetical protein
MWQRVGVMAVCVLLVAGCAATQQVAVEDQPAICGFIGRSCGLLQAGKEGEAGLRWVNPSADLTRYSKVSIDVVGFFGDPETADPEAQARLTDFFYKALHEALGKRYQVVSDRGPGVLKVQTAILAAEAATPGMRSISMAVPQARVLSTAAMGATGKYPFAGGVQAAIRIADSVNGKVLAAAVDNRVGGGSIQTAGVWEWGDAENIIAEWARLLSEKLYAYTSGTAKP